MPGILPALPRGRWLCECGPQGSWARAWQPVRPQEGRRGEPGRGLGPLFSSFQKSYQSNQNVTRARFRERFVPSLMPLPSQRLASLTPPSLQSPLPPWSQLDPRTALCGGWAGGAGGNRSGCSLHLTDEDTELQRGALARDPEAMSGASCLGLGVLCPSPGLLALEEELWGCQAWRIPAPPLLPASLGSAPPPEVPSRAS